MKKKILITSALPYANGPLHFGHIAGAYLPGDCYARFQRMLKNDVLYLCGSDEYGVAITLSAELAGRTPKEHVDLYHEVILNFFKKLNLSFDHYSRTTWAGHVKPVQNYFLDLLANGYIEEKVTDQLYSESDHRFLADRYVVGTCPKCEFENARGDECPKCGASYEAMDLKSPRSKLTNAPLSLKATKHWFIRLDLFKERLIDWLETKNWKPNVLNFVKQYIKDLRPRAITRDSSWGVPVPLQDTEGKVLYVWFDAPIGYISSAIEWAEKQETKDAWKDYWCDPETTLVNFIGKDNIPFHAVIFPAMTMGQNMPYKLVDELPANEFYMLEGRQFSKSEGWYIDLEDFFTRYSADQIRYTIASNAPETSDSEFTWKDFQLRCNTDLLGKYGNLVNRVLVFAVNQCGAKVPEMKNLQEGDLAFLKNIYSLVNEAKEAFAHFKLRRASQIMMELASLGNVYFDGNQPWKAAKDPEKRSAMETTIACCLECLKALCLISFPIIPETASSVWKMLGFHSLLNDLSWDQMIEAQIPAGQAFEKPTILFRRIEDEEIQKELEKLHALSQKQPPVLENVEYDKLQEVIDMDVVQKLDLRVAQILAAEPIEKSSKLFKLHVDLGFEKRTIVSGIKKHYEAKELIGKKVVVIANLKPAKLMGVESQGMLLAGSFGSDLEVVSVDHLPPGSKVK